MSGNITVESVEPGYKYSVGIGQEVFYDDRGDRVTTSPTKMRGGWAPSEEEAQRKAQKALEAMSE